MFTIRYCAPCGLFHICSVGAYSSISMLCLVWFGFDNRVRFSSRFYSICCHTRFSRIQIDISTTIWRIFQHEKERTHPNHMTESKKAFRRRRGRDEADELMKMYPKLSLKSVLTAIVHAHYCTHRLNEGKKIRISLCLNHSNLIVSQPICEEYSLNKFQIQFFDRIDCKFWISNIFHSEKNNIGRVISQVWDIEVFKWKKKIVYQIFKNSRMWGIKNVYHFIFDVFI